MGEGEVQVPSPQVAPQHSGRYLSARRILRNLGKRAGATILAILSYALAAVAAVSVLGLTAAGRGGVGWTIGVSLAGAAVAAAGYFLDADVRGGTASALYLHVVFLLVCALMLAKVW